MTNILWAIKETERQQRQAEQYFKNVGKFLASSVRYGIRIHYTFFPEDNRAAYQLTVPIDGLDRFTVTEDILFCHTVDYSEYALADHLRSILARKLGDMIVYGDRTRV